MTRVAVLDDYQHRAHEFADWGGLGPGVDTVFFPEAMTGDDLARAVAPFDVVVLMRERSAFPRRVLEQLPNLKMLVTTGMGNASVDTAWLSERGVLFTGTQTAPPGGGGVGGPVEIAFALIFGVTKRLVLEDQAMRRGSWQLGLPTNLAGLTLGLAGLGRLGSAMVPPARVFGMEVIAWSQNLTEERAAAVGVKRVTKEELLAGSDILSIHLVLSERTRGLFGATDLALMKPSAILINTSRGPIVDEDALVDALGDKRIAGAGLDVFDIEPLPAGHRLASLDNTVLAPHMGYVTESGLRHMYGQVVENISAFLSGRPVRVIAP